MYDLEVICNKLNKLAKALVGIRKYSAFMIALSVTSGLLILGFLDGSNYALVWTTGLPSFFGAMLAERLIKPNGTRTKRSS